MQNRLNNLIARALTLNDTRLGMSVPYVGGGTFGAVEAALGLTLPYDFIEINKKIRYDGFPDMDFFECEPDKAGLDGIIRNNINIKSCYVTESGAKGNLEHMLILADDDGGSVFMTGCDSREKRTPVIWCDYGEMAHYIKCGELTEDMNQWPSFTDFFEYLVEQEEAKLQEG